MAFGNQSNFRSTLARPALLGSALGAGAWRQLRRWIPRSRKRHALLTELDDWVLRDIGVIRERDIGVSREAAAHPANKLFWPP